MRGHGYDGRPVKVARLPPIRAVRRACPACVPRRWPRSSGSRSIALVPALALAADIPRITGPVTDETGVLEGRTGEIGRRSRTSSTSTVSSSSSSTSQPPTSGMPRTSRPRPPRPTRSGRTTRCSSSRSTTGRTRSGSRMGSTRSATTRSTRSSPTRWSRGFATATSRVRQSRPRRPSASRRVGRADQRARADGSRPYDSPGGGSTDEAAARAG